MESLNVIFTGKDQVETRRESIAAPKPDEVLVEASASLISTGTEGIVLGRRFEAGTHWDNWVKYPFYPGYCLAGRVVEVGDEVEKWKAGDRIAVRASHSQFNVVSGVAGRSAPIPDGVSDEDATWFGMAFIVQNGIRTAQHELGDSVVIVGAGILGQLVTQYVELMGAREIIVIDMAQPRLEMALSHGATHVLQMGAAEAREKVMELTGGRGADVVYDVTGYAPVFAAALGLVRDFGKLLLLGDTGTPSEQRLTIDVVTRGVRIFGAHDGHFSDVSTPRDFWAHDTMTQLFFTYLQRGQMKVADLITHRYAPQDAPAAYQMLQTDRSAALGVIFDWTQLKS